MDFCKDCRGKGYTLQGYTASQCRPCKGTGDAAPPARLTLDDYQDHAKVYAVYPGRGRDLTYPALGLAGEAGETVDKVKKVLRDHSGDPTFYREGILLELGDVLWYAALLADELDCTLGEVAQMNLDKLRDRLIKGTLQGEGDDR